MTTNEDIRTRSLRLIEETKSACLTTVGSDGYPQSRAFSNLRYKTDFPVLADFFLTQDEEFIQYIVTDTSSHKMKDIHSNTKVSIYFCDADAWHGLMLGGDIEIIDDPAIKQALWQEDWGRFYSGGPEDQEYTVLCLRPTTARGWHWKDTFEFDPRKSS